MKFANIEMLYLIWSVPLLFLVFYYGSRRRGKILGEYSALDSLSIIAPEFSAGRRWVKAGLLLAAVLFITVALSGPRYGYRWQEVERKGVDIFIAVDCSRSMLAEDIKPNRLSRAKHEIYDLLSMLEGDRAGLVAFAGTSFVQCPLTLDYQAFNLFMETLTPDFLPVGGTDLAGAIETALAGFSEKSNTEKAVILITDGESTGGDAVKAAEKAQKAGVRIFAIGVGKKEGIPLPGKDGGFKKDRTGQIVLAKIDEETLKKISGLTGGAYVRSEAGDMDLKNIYSKHIRGEMERKTLASGKKKVWEDRYQWFLGIAVLLLIASMALSSVCLRRPSGGSADGQTFEKFDKQVRQ